MTAVYILIALSLLLLYMACSYKSKKQLSDKILEYIKNNPDKSLTVVAGDISNTEEFNFISFSVAEEYCHRLDDGKSVKDLDEKYGDTYKLNLPGNKI